MDPDQPRCSGEGYDQPTCRPTVRLNRFLATAGLGSRRGVEELIAAGRVTINGRVVEEPGTQVAPGKDQVSLDGEPVPAGAAPIYILLFKPRGVLTTAYDPHGRRTVLDLLPPARSGARLFPVGRLDLESEGLVLLTNDGALTHRLLHPRYHVAKRYRVWTDPAPSPAALAALARGVQIAPRVTTRAAEITPRGVRGFEIVLKEGKKRQIRLMCEAVGLRVTRLVRVSLGPLRIGRLRPGQHRPLTAAEVESLRRAAGAQ
jgi:23S rRNA pseudouridine2605 synthase